MNSINETGIKHLRDRFMDDRDVLQLINDCLQSFSDYHASIYRMEIYKKLNGYDNTDKEEYQAELTDLDKARSSCHNSVIANIRIFNRLCEQNSIPLIFEGIISEDRPYRIEIADAVLTYIEEEVKNRTK